LRPAPSAAANALDLLFGRSDSSLLDEALQVPFAGDLLTSFEAGYDLGSAAPDAARLDEGRDALFSSNDDVLTDRSDAVEAGALNPAAVVVLMGGLGGIAVAQRRERAPEPEARTRQGFQD
jgi:hypothetical protein